MKILLSSQRNVTQLMEWMYREMRRVVADGTQEGVWLVAGTGMVGYVTWRKG